jgi:probable rRNA maturation factor
VKEAVLPALALEVQDASRSIDVPTARSLRAWCRAALRKDCAVTMRIVGKPEGATLNEQFRGKDYPTNVLTFVYESRPACVGDIVLCAPVVRTEARQQGKALRAHWAHLVVHGMLHLQGFDHETPAQARRMERLEKQILSELGYPDPYVVAA